MSLQIFRRFLANSTNSTSSTSSTNSTSLFYKTSSKKPIITKMSEHKLMLYNEYSMYPPPNTNCTMISNKSTYKSPQITSYPNLSQPIIKLLKP